MFPRDKALEIFKYLHDKVMKELTESKDEVRGRMDGVAYKRKSSVF
jgi:hypothetical protein